MVLNSLLKKNSKVVKKFFKKNNKLSMNNHSENIIVSLTSFPERIDNLYKTIESLFNQSIRPNKIVLWLNKLQFAKIDLPKSLTEITKIGLEIKWVKKDFKSFNKLYYSLIEYPSDIIITVDDDQIYMKNLIKELIKAHKKYPDSIISTTLHEYITKNNQLLSYYDRRVNSQRSHPKIAQTPRYCHQLMGYAGVLYKKVFFNDEFFNYSSFTKLCHKNDDIWFWAMGVHNSTRTCSVKNSCYPINHYQKPSPNSLSQFNKDPNYQYNTGSQFINVINTYPDIKKKMLDENLNINNI
ncbi:MAG: glycosyl transferase [Mycoplasmoidaceae bacterium]|nr:MAG: glycosyl transferase [Mycoplasmoidaceae bacterium]